jgi:hypothetical protein
LLAIDLVPRPVPSSVVAEVLEFCLAGLKEKRDLISLTSLRSLGVSKILKSELLALQSQVSKSQILPNILTSRNLAQNVLVDLCVPDIRPICTFLRNFDGDDQWRTLSVIGTSLEKSTQAKIWSKLETKDVEIFNPILKQGVSNFENDGSYPNFSLILVLIRKVTLGFLRVCINLTNSSGAVCESLVTDLTLPTVLAQIITSDPQRYCDAEYHKDTISVDDSSSTHEEEHEKKESRFELLLLSLGLMINFVQESDKVKDLILAGPFAIDIKYVFEKLVAREVFC